jgi:hypothetical protein
VSLSHETICESLRRGILGADGFRRQRLQMGAAVRPGRVLQWNYDELLEEDSLDDYD